MYIDKYFKYMYAILIMKGLNIQNKAHIFFQDIEFEPMKVEMYFEI